MVRRMRARLQKFLPIVLIALVMQVLAPIAACWAAGQAVADPLGTAVICHSTSEQGAGLDDQTGAPAGHAGACALCCLAQANASLDSPLQATFSIPFRHAESLVWHDAADHLAAPDRGSTAQARAPPQFS
ncbi:MULTISPECIES: DUF2946 domain-containing protein [unclassified Bradyrhizobium]|uniref:DUF2946 domain-containing protein n=1 Tax=unclassified Bradyrhizobium TaxID=2631580 RepID=UPI00247A9B03|nr:MULTISPECIES: DUF2946 domain-containing protein [unclassified Bradyrhizobium]WGR74827.1 DUF2946 domain-containing protein [Bradyrhizobium sp. ISRA426]WGR79663.1 DUF2946 domain-containing protein [Bradyrhizobium sp. ISRA430]WGR89999.1 DUF2946 domain-containing protein [Bradyrhizobium sp. ISRA432]